MYAAVVVMSCATDHELAKNLHGYLRARLQAIVDNAKVNGMLESDEIIVDAGSKMSKDDVLDALSAFIESDPDRDGEYRITEFDDALIIGIPSGHGQSLEDMHQCDMCNYMTKYEEQLRQHKMIHGNVLIG